MGFSHFIEPQASGISEQIAPRHMQQIKIHWRHDHQYSFTSKYTSTYDHLKYQPERDEKYHSRNIISREITWKSCHYIEHHSTNKTTIGSKVKRFQISRYIYINDINYVDIQRSVWLYALAQQIAK
jgi:hypothetical protein